MSMSQCRFWIWAIALVVASPLLVAGLYGTWIDQFPGWRWAGGLGLLSLAVAGVVKPHDHTVGEALAVRKVHLSLIVGCGSGAVLYATDTVTAGCVFFLVVIAAITARAVFEARFRPRLENAIVAIASRSVPVLLSLYVLESGLTSPFALAAWMGLVLGGLVTVAELSDGPRLQRPVRSAV